MKNKVTYIPAIKHPDLTNAPDGKIVSIMDNGICYSAQNVMALEVKVYYRRLWVQLLAKRMQKAKGNNND